MNPARIARLALLACLPLFAAAANAQTVDTLADPNLFAIVNGRAYPVRPVEIMMTSVRATRADASYALMIDSLIDNQLLAGQALKEFPKSELFGTTRVGFSAPVILEEQYSSLLRTHFAKELDAFVKTRPNGKLDSVIVKHFRQNDPSLKELMTLRDRGEVKLTEKQMALAAKTPVASVRMPDGTGSVLTFADIYARQHLQGRIKLIQEHDLGYLDAQIRSHVETMFVNWWAETKSGLAPDELALLRTMLEEKYLKEHYLGATGAVTVVHEDTPPVLLKLQSEVTDAEIADWYEKNKEAFREIDKVLVRQVECATEEACDAAKVAFEKGMDFSEVAKKFSIAESRNATPAGSLGWIERKDNRLGWLGEVAMIGKKGQLTGPIRSPEDAKGKATWHLVLVDERVDGYNPLDSDTVRYQARGEIAKHRAVDGFKAMHDNLRANADIQRNGKLIAARAEARP